DRGRLRDGICRGLPTARDRRPERGTVPRVRGVRGRPPPGAYRAAGPVSRAQPVSLDERDDRSGQGEELLRDPRYRVPERRHALLALIPGGITARTEAGAPAAPGPASPCAGRSRRAHRAFSDRTAPDGQAARRIPAPVRTARPLRPAGP